MPRPVLPRASTSWVLPTPPPEVTTAAAVRLVLLGSESVRPGSTGVAPWPAAYVRLPTVVVIAGAGLNWAPTVIVLVAEPWLTPSLAVKVTVRWAVLGFWVLLLKYVTDRRASW